MAADDESKGLQELYPPIEPYDDAMLKLNDVHTMHYEQVGNPDGKPVIFVHGGPGGGLVPEYRQFFDPKVFRVVLFDQRGCGKSTPHASLEDNTTWHLVEDMETLRKHLGIEKWMVFGGSWGSTLGLAYAESHPDRVSEIVLRGIFMLRRKELLWFYQEGASFVYPDAWEPYLNHIPEDERDDMMAAYYKRLTSDDEAVRTAAAIEWSKWEGSCSKLIPSASYSDKYAVDSFALAFARVECHYFVNRGFFETDSWLLDNVDKLRERGIPAFCAQGRYDMVCPYYTAYALRKKWPEMEFELLQTAGHSCFEPTIRDALLRACDRYGKLGTEAASKEAGAE